MDRQDTPTEPPSDNKAEGFVAIGRFSSERRAHEAGLSVLAAGHHYWVQLKEDRFLLIVRTEHASMLRREIEIAAIRNRYWPPRSLDLPLLSISPLPTASFVVLIIVVFALQNRLPGLEDLGANSSGAVFGNDEWWRTVTAITLHADLRHLIGNIFGISLFGHLCGRYMGNGLAWLLVIGIATLSNLTNVFLNAGHEYVSLGASTAVFAALGLLAGFPIGTFLRSRDPIQTRDWLVPLAGGCILFAWMGGGDFPTDVAGHLWSFGYGLIASVAVAFTAIHAKLKVLHQRMLLGVAAAAIGGSWAWAVTQ